MHGWNMVWLGGLQNECWGHQRQTKIKVRIADKNVLFKEVGVTCKEIWKNMSSKVHDNCS